MHGLPYRISTLVYLRNTQNQLLLMRRENPPNRGLWSPIGGKLEMATGESPYEAAAREVAEEVALHLQPGDLHLFAMIAEKHYENRFHWLMFLFDCRRPLAALPPPIPEGHFAFFDEGRIDTLAVPETDRQALWPAYFKARDGFTAFRADCRTEADLQVEVEEFLPAPGKPGKSRG